jgi:hypothetical protein
VLKVQQKALKRGIVPGEQGQSRHWIRRVGIALCKREESTQKRPC